MLGLQMRQFYTVVICSNVVIFQGLLFRCYIVLHLCNKYYSCERCVAIFTLFLCVVSDFSTYVLWSFV